jgi:hypothetical protein
MHFAKAQPLTKYDKVQPKARPPQNSPCGENIFKFSAPVERIYVGRVKQPTTKQLMQDSV